jgi:hypothetical protein
MARRLLAASILAAYAVLHGMESSWFFSAACAVGAIVMLRPTFWARRYTMGIALAGLLNIAAYYAYWRELAWIQGIAFALLFVALVGKKMRRTFDERAEHWKFDHWTMHVLGGALSLNVAGIGMLVQYASGDAGTQSLRASAFCLAALLSVGSIASARGRIAGLFAMTLAGGAAIWLGFQAVAGTAMCSPQQFEAVKAISGFGPAALGSIACFVVFLGPMVRFVRNKTV